MKTEVRWTCDNCHQSCVTIASRDEDPADFEPVIARVKCPVCSGVSTKAFRPGTDPNTEESYTVEEWINRTRYRKLQPEVAPKRSERRPPPAPEREPGPLSESELDEIEAKARQCQPPHVASTWALVPPVNEWYAKDVPRLLSELRALRQRFERRRLPRK